MENKSNSHGRTVFDLISENPKKALYIFIGIVIIFLIFLLMGNSFKVGSLEVNGKEKIVHDTIIKVIKDTIIIEKPKITTKYIKPTKKTSDIEVKDKNTDVKVSDQPSNINTGTNNGIVGNNNTFNNITEIPIELNNNDKINLINMVNSELKKTVNEKAKKITIAGMLGNVRSLQMAKLIQEFLKSKGYDTGNGIAQFVPSNPEKGIFIFADGEDVKINVLII